MDFEADCTGVDVARPAGGRIFALEGGRLIELVEGQRLVLIELDALTFLPVPPGFFVSLVAHPDGKHGLSLTQQVDALYRTTSLVKDLPPSVTRTLSMVRLPPGGLQDVDGDGIQDLPE